jgi:hypothetical protein
VTLAAKGLLVEEQRANLLLQSENFTTSWTPTRVSVSANVTTSPDGTSNADKLVEDISNNSHFINQSVASVAGGASVAVSIYAKVAGRNFLAFVTADSASTFRTSYFNLANGTLGTIAAGHTASIQALGNGWYRCVIITTQGVSTGGFTFYPGIANSDGSPSYLGDGTSGIYIYGSQLEAGAFATSYIPTTASQVTRAADVASVNTLSPWYNSVAGTLYAEFLASVDATGTYRTQLRIVDAGSTNYVQMRYQNPSATTAVTNNQVVAGTTQADLTSASLSAPAILKTALSFAANNFSACTNGATPVTDVSGTMPTGLASLSFTGGSFNSGQTWMRRITYYPRVFTAAEQQTLTTL